MIKNVIKAATANVMLVVLGAHTAAANCPANLEKAQKITLSAGEAYRRDVVRNADGTIELTRKMPAQREPSTVTLLKGLLPLGSKAPQQGAVKYETDPAAIFPLKTGDKHTLKYTATSASGTPFEATMSIDVRATEKIDIAGCALDTIVLSRSVRFASGQRTPTFIEYYAPAVGFVVRAAMVTSDGSIVNNANETFEKIVAE